MAQAKALGWRNSGGGEPHSGMRLCPTHRFVELNKNCANMFGFCHISDLKVQAVPGGGLATFDGKRLRFLLLLVLAWTKAQAKPKARWSFQTFVSSRIDHVGIASTSTSSVVLV